MSHSSNEAHDQDLAPQREPATPDLAREFQESKQLLINTWGPVVLLTVTAFAIAWMFVEPAPPHSIKIAAGPREGAYYRYAEEYAQLFAENGYELEVIETAGSIENYQLLAADNGINLAIVQGGTRPVDAGQDSYEAIASLYYEPLWIFHRGTEPLTRLQQLAGQRVAIGPAESGTRAVMETLLQANGLITADQLQFQAPKSTSSTSTTSPADESTAAPASVSDGTESPTSIIPVAVGGERAAQQLLTGEVQAAAFVLPAGHLLVRRLLQEPEIQLLEFDRLTAYNRIFPYLSQVTLYEGVLDLQVNLPERDLPLLSPAANLIATHDLHDAFVPLLIKAATRVHDQGGILTPQGKFPSLDYVEFPVHAAALDFFEYGPSFLNRYLPFWLSSFLNRMKIMLLPLITLAIPLIKLAPPIYRWQIRARIYRWYDLLREIDQARSSQSPEELKQHLESLRQMQEELRTVQVPLSYMEEFYHLHLHVELVKNRLLAELNPPKPEDVALEDA